MVLGNPQNWLDRFKSIDNKLLCCIERIWPVCLEALQEQPDEDTITINLVALLSKDQEVCRLAHWIEYQYEPFGHGENGAMHSKGIIDMAVILDQNRERYIAYECKRLNVVRNGGRSSLATPYVKEGLKRFVFEQYAEGLPLGCMLGYVLDGDMDFALSRTASAIVETASFTRLVGNIEKLSAINTLERFSTRHKRESSSYDIEIRHTLLPFPSSQ
ncbi:hypothetical protein MLD52_08025 [Puniceicoccaceae bacterium K14]|nr:hypothetical protein [Puniceicoccaceae bacterium K14]